ncbi:MAG: hypothetical protein JW811_00850 [Clostridiales bacterium]|nr:hypothetical protein [Clostridiales bacterium]
MHQCGAKCCGKGQRRTAKRLFDESQSLRDFLERIGKHDVENGALRYTLRMNIPSSRSTAAASASRRRTRKYLSAA